MSILILAEHDGRQLKKATRQTINAAQAWGLPVHLLLVGNNTEAAAANAAQVNGVTRIIRVDAPHLAHPLAEDVAILTASLGHEYTIIAAAHTTFAKNILPRTAALLDVAMVADVIGIKAPNIYARPIYAGSVLATVENTDALQVVTVRATSFDAAGDGGHAEITTLPAPAATSKSRWVSEVRNESDQPDLASAPVVVSGGRSLGEQFHQLLTPLAKKLAGAVGATRAAVDAGYAPNDWQVGQTGTIVAPGLYIAAGISGAAQHLAGMKDSKIIVAINHDPDAPIFDIADYGLVADLFEALPALTAAISK